MAILHVDDNNFEAEVLQSTLPVLVDFGAVWCGPCQRQTPIIEKFATLHADKFKVCTVDIDDSPIVASKFGIRALPSLVVFHQGHKLDSRVGLTAFPQLESFCLSKIEQ